MRASEGFRFSTGVEGEWRLGILGIRSGSARILFRLLHVFVWV